MIPNDGRIVSFFERDELLPSFRVPTVGQKETVVCVECDFCRKCKAVEHGAPFKFIIKQEPFLFDEGDLPVEEFLLSLSKRAVPDRLFRSSLLLQDELDLLGPYISLPKRFLQMLFCLRKQCQLHLNHAMQCGVFLGDGQNP